MTRISEGRMESISVSTTTYWKDKTRAALFAADTYQNFGYDLPLTITIKVEKSGAYSVQIAITALLVDTLIRIYCEEWLHTWTKEQAGTFLYENLVVGNGRKNSVS